MAESMGWVYLIVAGLFEISWALGLKYSQGFTKFLPSTFTLATMSLSIIFLSKAIRTVPLASAYAIWTGIGVVGVSIFGALYLAESINFKRAVCISFILVGIIGLRVFTPETTN